MRTHIVALGGSLLRPEASEDPGAWLSRLREIIVHVEGLGHRIGLVVGGGLPARQGISLLGAILQEPDRLDRVGIAATRLNARIILEVLDSIGVSVARRIPLSIDEAVEALSESNVVVMGGTEPGHTTDTVAIRWATAVRADHAIIATNVSHVHSADPSEDADAVAFDEMTHEQLIELCGEEGHAPGRSAVVDPIGAKLAADHGLPIAVLDGRDLAHLDDAMCGEAFVGTLIRT